MPATSSSLILPVTCGRGRQQQEASVGNWRRPGGATQSRMAVWRPYLWPPSSPRACAPCGQRWAWQRPRCCCCWWRSCQTPSWPGLADWLLAAAAATAAPAHGCRAPQPSWRACCVEIGGRLSSLPRVFSEAAGTDTNGIACCLGRLQASSLCQAAAGGLARTNSPILDNTGHLTAKRRLQDHCRCCRPCNRSASRVRRTQSHRRPLRAAHPRAPQVHRPQTSTTCLALTQLAAAYSAAATHTPH